MSHIENFLCVILIVCIIGMIGFIVYVICLRVKYAKKLRLELENMSVEDLQGILCQTGYLLNTHGDCFSIRTVVYYRMRYALVQKKLQKLQEKK